jgi:DNA-binding NarL/FixJ family response regulator
MSRVTGVVPAVASTWPLVGRDAELQQIAAARNDSNCPAAVIVAPAGVGKSRLAREVYAVAQTEDAPTLWAQATASSATIPLGALAGLVPDDVRSDDPLELVRGTVAAVRERHDERRLLLVVDDAQLLDPTSATLVLQLASTSEVFVLATIRSREPTPDAVDSLWKDGGALRIELGAISDDAIERLVEAGVGGAIDQATITQIVDSCVGNPLYARELVIGAVEDGRMRQDRGLWRLEGRPAVTPSLTALIKRRTETLSPEQLRPLELLALGEPLRLSELAELTSYEVLESAEERGMLVIDGPSPDAEVRLQHPLYSDVMRVDLPVLRARSHRLALAAVLQQRQPLSPDDALRAARWLIDAGAEIPSDLLIDAAGAANLAGDPGLGAELARRAIDAGAGLHAVLLLARAHTIRNRFDDAELVLAEAEPDATSDPETLQYLAQRMHVLYWGLQQTDRARELLDRAQRWSDGPGWSQLLEPWRISMGGFSDGFGARLESIRETLRQPDLDPRTRSAIEVHEGLALLGAGRLREATALCRRLRPRPPLRDNVDAYALGLTCLVIEESGEDWPSDRAYMQQTLKTATRIGDHEAAGLAAFTLGVLDLHAGRYRDSARWLVESETQFEHHDTFDTLTTIRALQVGLACFTGDPATARAAAQSIERRLSQTGPRPTQQIHLACAEGWAARSRSDAEGAATFLQRAASTDDPTVQARLLHEALRSGAPPGPIANALTKLADSHDSVLTEARTAHAVALAQRDGNALVDVGERLATIGCDAAAVEAIIAGSRAFLADGRESAARRAAARAQTLHPADQDWDLPTVDGLNGIAAGLTPREAQIASLAARGLTSQQIADELVLSVRTIETYIYRAMQKRGVDRRQDL